MILWKTDIFITLIDEEDIYTSVLTHNGVIIDIEMILSTQRYNDL